MRGHRRREWLSLLLAYAIVLQPLLGAVALGSHSLDTIEICTVEGVATVPVGGAPSQDHRAPCCPPGCTMLAPPVLPQPSALLFAPAGHVLATLAAPHDSLPPARPSYRPSNPRAPPLVS